MPLNAVLYTPIGMRLRHHALEVDFPEESLAAVRAAGFTPSTNSYPVLAPGSGTRSYEVAIVEIAAVQRAPGIPLLKKDRVDSILQAFMDGVPLPPVEVVPLREDDGPTFKLTAGAHRLYSSMAVGFTHVPAIDGFDWASLDQ